MNRRIRNRMYGGVGGRRAKAFLLPDYGFYDICNQYRLFSDGDTGKISQVLTNPIFMV